MTQLKPISPRDAAALIETGALVVDIREATERESGIIRNAAHAPLSALSACAIPVAPGQPVIFHCKTGGRTGLNAEALADKVRGGDPYVLQGGIDAWRAEGLPVDQPE